MLNITREHLRTGLSILGKTGPAGDVPPELPEELARGLARLAASPPLWTIGRPQWLALVDIVAAFALRWDSQALPYGWCSLALYGLHPRAPAANLAAMALPGQLRSRTIGRSPRRPRDRGGD